MGYLHFVCLGLIILVAGCLGNFVCDHCNCQISSQNKPQAVYNLALVCNTGTVTWFDAFGAIRLNMTPFLRGMFKACFLAESENSYVQVSQEVLSRKSNKTGTLRFNHLVSSGAKRQEMCFKWNTDRKLVLYLEAIKIPGVNAVPKINFHYDLEKLQSQHLSDDCRPCSKNELLDSYCSMDFVVIGSIADVSHNKFSEMSNLTLNIKQVIHQTEESFFKRVKRSDKDLMGFVTVPKKCQMKKVAGDFFVTGRQRLNSLTLVCITHLHDWRAIQHEVECSH